MAFEPHVWRQNSSSTRTMDLWYQAPDDLRFVVRAVHSLCRQYHGIGMSLRVRHLDEIEGRFPRDSLRRLIAVLNDWLKEAVDRDRNPDPPTWRKLVYVVADPLGGNHPSEGAYIAENYEVKVYQGRTTFPAECTCFLHVALWRFQPSRLALTASADLIVEDHMNNADIQHFVLEVSSLLVEVQSRWYEIGVLLGVPLHHLDGLLQNPDLSCLDLLRKVVELWLKDRERQRSWQMLVDTVEHHAGGNHPSLARRIAEQHTASGNGHRPQEEHIPTPQDTREVQSQKSEVSSPNLGDPPTIQEFQCLKWTNNGRQNCIRIMSKVAPRWRDFGIALGFRVEELDVIEQGCFRQPRECIQKLFGDWARSKGNYSWEGLIEALKDSEHDNLADDVLEALKQRSDTQPEEPANIVGPSEATLDKGYWMRRAGELSLKLQQDCEYWSQQVREASNVLERHVQKKAGSTPHAGD